LYEVWQLIYGCEYKVVGKGIWGNGKYFSGKIRLIGYYGWISEDDFFLDEEADDLDEEEEDLLRLLLFEDIKFYISKI